MRNPPKRGQKGATPPTPALPPDPMSPDSVQPHGTTSYSGPAVSLLAPMRQALRDGIHAGLNVLLWGLPGIGKTAIVEQLCAEEGWGLVGLSLATMQAEDVGGLPVVRAEAVEHLPAWWVERACRLAQEKGVCVLLADEFSCATPAVQAALLTAVQSGRVGSRELPRGGPTGRVAWVACANPVDQAADGWELALPTISRWVQLQWPIPSVDEWIDWLLNYAVRPTDDPLGLWAGDAGARARGLVAGFLSRRADPEDLCATHANRPRGDSRPYPCPRSWEFAARALAATLPAQGELEPRLIRAENLVTGCLGAGVTTELMAFLRTGDLIDPETLLAHPEAWSPTLGRPDRCRANLLGAVAALLARPWTQTRLDAMIALALRAQQAGYAGLLVTALHALFGTPTWRALSHGQRLPGLHLPPEVLELGEIAAVASALITPHDPQSDHDPRSDP